jgi:hypothetical protein
VAEEQLKTSERLDRELATMKRSFEESEEEYKYQIARLTKQLQEKQASDSSTHTRYDKQAKEKEHELARLETTIQKMREDYTAMVDEKNKEIERVKEKFQLIMTQELGSLSKNMTNQDQKFKIELDGLRSIIELKNEDIINLQKELKINLEDHAADREALNAEIQLLRSKIYEREREN